MLIVLIPRTDMESDGNLLDDWRNEQGGAGLQYGEGWK